MILSLSQLKFREYATTIHKLVANCDTLEYLSYAFNGCKVEEVYCKRNSEFYKYFSKKPSTKVTITGTYLSEENVSLMVGQTYQLKVFNPVGDTKWSSSDAAVVSVSNGLLTCVNKGSAVITAVNNGVTMTCKVTVADLSLNYQKTKIALGCTTKLILPGASL